MKILNFHRLKREKNSIIIFTLCLRTHILLTFDYYLIPMSMLLITILLGMPGLPQILLIALVLLLLFGGRKIPELMRGLGRGIKEFKSASSEEKKTDKEIKDNSES